MSMIIGVKKITSQKIALLQLFLSNSYKYDTLKKCNVNYLCKASVALNISLIFSNSHSRSFTKQGMCVCETKENQKLFV